MERKQRAKYLILIYLFVGSLAMIALILGFQRESDTWQSVFLNIGTELLGAVFTFFFVGYLFSLDELELGDRIEKLVRRLEDADKDKVLASKFLNNAVPDIGNLIRNSTQLDFCGAVLAGTIDKNLSLLKDVLKQGTSIRILIMTKNIEVVKIAAARSEGDDVNYYLKKLEMTFQNVDYLQKYATNTLKLSSNAFQVKLLKYPPSCGMLNFKNKDSGILQIEMYAHHVGWGEPPIFTLDRKLDVEWYNYFQHQFDAMWERAEKYEPN